jgi:hypothetical protein
MLQFEVELEKLGRKNSLRGYVNTHHELDSGIIFFRPRIAIFSVYSLYRKYIHTMCFGLISHLQVYQLA